jgi:hypothetical protein
MPAAPDGTVIAPVSLGNDAYEAPGAVLETTL